MNASLFLPEPIGKTEAERIGRLQGKLWLRALRIGLPAKFVTFPQMNTTTTGSIPRGALPSVRVREALSEPALAEPLRTVIRLRTAREMEFGTHWIWRHGAEHFTAEGLRFLADAYNRERDQAAELVCRKLADDLDASDALNTARRAPVPCASDEVDTFAQLEKRGLA